MANLITELRRRGAAWDKAVAEKWSIEVLETAVAVSPSPNNPQSRVSTGRYRASLAISVNFPSDYQATVSRSYDVPDRSDAVSKLSDRRTGEKVFISNALDYAVFVEQRYGVLEIAARFGGELLSSLSGEEFK